MTQTYRVKFANHADADMVVSLAPTELCGKIMAEVRAVKAIANSKHIRLICAGKELYPDDPLYKVGSLVIHCMVTDAPPAAPPNTVVEPAPPPPTRTQQQLDWLDTVDPGVVLMWVFGIILAIAWLLLLVYPSLYDRNCVIVLCMMSIVFLIPCGLSYFMFYYPHPQPQGRPGHAYDSAHGYSTAVNPAHGGFVIPPRPHARVRGPHGTAAH